jgi:hypothetical protein
LEKEPINRHKAITLYSVFLCIIFFVFGVFGYSRALRARWEFALRANSGLCKLS